MLPTLETARLILRPFTLADAPTVKLLAGDHDLASTTMNLPHPYPEGAAETWIATHTEKFEQGTLAALAITLRPADELIGAISLGINQAHRRAELGYWLGKPWWNQGYMTEAARALIGCGFETFNLNRISAQHFVRNPASGRVMQKLGMTYEGCLRQAMLKWDRFEDLMCYAILREDWNAAQH